MVLVVLLQTLLAAPPVLCVDVARSAKVDRANLIAAIRARVEGRPIEVRPCALSGGTWRLSVKKARAGKRIRVVGPDVSVDRVLDTGRATPEEVVLLIATTTVEAIRPSMEARLGGTAADCPEPTPCPPPVPCPKCEATKCPDPPPCPDCPDCPEPAPCPDCPEPEPCPDCPDCPTCPPVPTEVRPLGLSVAVAVGPRFSISDASPGLHAELGVGVFSGRVRSELTLAAQALSSIEDADLVSVEVGIGGSLDLGPAFAGVRAVARMTSTSHPNLPESQYIWSPGIGLGGGVSLFSAVGLSFGLAGGLWIWPQPNGLLVEGERLGQDPRWEFFVGPRIHRTILF